MSGYEHRASILEGAGDTIFKLVCDRATPGQWTEWLRAPLEHAAGTGNQDLVDKLLRAGANGSAGWRGCHGETLLHAAVRGGNKTVMETLMWKCGLDRDASASRDGRTPLHRAVLDGKDDIAKMLVMSRVDLDIRDNSGDTPLHLAIKGGHVGLAEMLLLGGASPDTKGLDGSYPIHTAIRLGQHEVVRNLVQSRATLTCLNAERKTPLAIAVREERVSLAKLLLAGGADPDFTKASLRRKTALHHAAESNKTAAIPALIEAGAKVDAFDADRSTPLYIAVWRGSCAAALTLLQLGAKVNMKCKGEGSTPLHAACYQNNPDAADLLLRWGANEAATTDDGGTSSSKMQAVATASEDGRAKLERLSKLLARAPQDRAWRRRGFLVMCREYPDRVRLASKKTGAVAATIRHPTERPSCRAKRAQVPDKVDNAHGRPAGDRAGGAFVGGGAQREDVDGGFESVAAWLMALTDEDALRKIVWYL